MTGTSLDPAAQSGEEHVRTAVLATTAQVGGLALSIVQYGLAARFFGARHQMDGFLAAWIIPTTMVSVAFALQNMLVPYFAQERADAGTDAAWRLASESLGLTIVAFGLASVGGAGLAHFAIGFVTAGSGPETTRIAQELLPLGFVFGYLFLIANVLTGLATAVGRFLVTAVLANVASTAPVLFLWLGARRLGIACLPLGLVAGAVAQVVVLACLLYRMGLRIRLPKRQGWARVGRLASDSFAFGLAQIPLQAMPLAERHFAAAAGEGAMSHLFYASKFFTAGWQLLGMTLSVLGLSILSAYLARKEMARFHQLFSLLLRVASYLSAAYWVGLTIAGRSVIEAVFEHGRFSRADTVVVARVVVWYLIGLFGVLVGSTVTAALVARRRVYVLPVANLFGFVCYLACVLWGGAVEADPVQRLAMAYGIGLNATLIPIVAHAIRQKLVEGRVFIDAALRTALFIPALAIPFWFVQRWVEHENLGGLAAVSILAMACGCLAAVALAAVDREVFGRLLAASRLRRRRPTLPGVMGSAS